MEGLLHPHPYVSTNDVEVVEHAGEKRLVTRFKAAPGRLLFTVVLSELQPFPTRTSIQVYTDLHVECGDRLCYMDHSFSPTCRINTQDGVLTVTAIKPLVPGDPITFDYNTTEADMAEPFQDRETGRWVKGWNHLSNVEKFDIQSLALPYLK